MRRPGRAIARVLLFACLLTPVPSFAQDLMAAAPAGQRRIIVTLRDDVSLDAYAGAFVADDRLQDTRRFGYHARPVLGAIMTLERRHGFRASAFYSRALKGFAATVTPAVAARLAADPLVLAVEPDDPVTLAPVEGIQAGSSQIVDWGIYKIGADQTLAHSGDGMGTVTGVNIYVIDTGVDPTHPDINLVNHVSFIPNEPNADCNGHGTGVSGIIAGRDNDAFTVGVVPGAPVTGVKVLTCDGVTFPSLIVQGVDWVTANAVKPAVANMSLGSLIRLAAVDTAVRNSAASGIFYALAAGNGNPFDNNSPLDACTTSPAAVGGGLNGIMTAAATDQEDVEAPFSNYGACVDIWAPGVAVTAPWLMSQGGLITASGTSFSSPYVAGAGAYLLSRIPTLPPWFVELVIKLTVDIPGTTSFDGAPIRRLQIRRFQ
jgi:subtilisin family serine protease